MARRDVMHNSYKAQAALAEIARLQIREGYAYLKP